MKKALRPGRAALLGVIVREDRAFIADAIDVGRLADHQAAVVDARLHDADVVAHDEEDVGLLRRLLCRRRRAGWSGQRDRHQRRRAEQRGAGSRMPCVCVSCAKRLESSEVCSRGCQSDMAFTLLFVMHQRLLA